MCSELCSCYGLLQGRKWESENVKMLNNGNHKCALVMENVKTKTLFTLRLGIASVAAMEPESQASPVFPVPPVPAGAPCTLGTRACARDTAQLRWLNFV